MTLRRKIWSSVLVLLLVGFVAADYALTHAPAPHPAPVPADPAQRMKAVVYYQYGGPEVLRIVEVAKPPAGDHDVLINVRAASLNPYEWHFMTGTPFLVRLIGGLRAPKNYRLGIDFAGTVVAAGKEVTRYKVGDRVFGGTDGALAEYVSMPESDVTLASIPDNTSFEQAGSVAIRFW
jgi:NADPH:quinone reductase-like Zn-dependent oxidoreductase